MQFKIRDHKLFINHLLLSDRSLAKDVAATEEWEGEGELTARLVINGVDVPVDVWEAYMTSLTKRIEAEFREKYDSNNFDRRVELEVKSILKSSVGDIVDKLSGLSVSIDYAEGFIDGRQRNDL